MSLKLVRIALWQRCLVGLSSTIFQIIWAPCSRNVSRGLWAPSWCSWVLNLLALLCLELVRLAAYKGKPGSPYVSHCAGAVPEVELFLAVSGAFQNHPLGVLLVWLIELSSGVLWSPLVFVLVLSPLGWGSGTSQCQMLPITGLRLPM